MAESSIEECSSFNFYYDCDTCADLFELRVIFKINKMNPLGNIDKFPEAAMNKACYVDGNWKKANTFEPIGCRRGKHIVERFPQKRMCDCRRLEIRILSDFGIYLITFSCGFAVKHDPNDVIKLRVDLSRLPRVWIPVKIPFDEYRIDFISPLTITPLIPSNADQGEREKPQSYILLDRWDHQQIE